MTIWQLLSGYFLIGLFLDHVFMWSEVRRNYEKQYPGRSIRNARIACLLLWPLVIFTMILNIATGK